MGDLTKRHPNLISTTNGASGEFLLPNGATSSLRSFAQSIVETVRHPLLILNSRLRAAKANIAFYRAFRVSEAEVEGLPLANLAAGEWNIPQLHKSVEAALTSDRVVEDFLLEQDFSKIGHRVLLLNIRRVHHEDGTPNVLLAIEDVTERAQAQAELHRMNAELERRVIERTAELETANRELEAFCYSVSHDLRAPLRAMDGFSQELMQTYATRLDPKGQNYLVRVRAASQRMAQLIEDLLQLSRISRFELRREHVDLSAMAAAVAAEIQERYPHHHPRVRIQPGLVLYGDSRLLRIVLENLLDNAWKFTGKTLQAEINVGQAERAGRITFFIEDNGAGFDNAYTSKLFGAFQRLHPEREFPGTGIGLATVQRIVHRHGGEVWAEGRPGRGATFSFLLGMQPKESV